MSRHATFWLLGAFIISVSEPGLAQNTRQIADTVKPISRSDVMVGSAVGSVLGGFVGAIAAVPAACGQYIRTGHCQVPKMAIGFGTGTWFGTTVGAAWSAHRGQCRWPERVLRSAVGALAGYGASLPIVAATRGFVRIGAAPIVPLAGAAGATLALGHCLSP